MAIGFLVERDYPAQLPLAWLAGWLAGWLDGWLVHRGSPALWMGGCCLFGEAGRAVVPSQIQVQLYGFHYKSTPTARLLYRYTVEPLEPLTFNPHFPRSIISFVSLRPRYPACDPAWSSRCLPPQGQRKHRECIFQFGSLPIPRATSESENPLPLLSYDTPCTSLWRITLASAHHAIYISHEVTIVFARVHVGRSNCGRQIRNSNGWMLPLKG